MIKYATAKSLESSLKSKRQRRFKLIVALATITGAKRDLLARSKSDTALAVCSKEIAKNLRN